MNETKREVRFFNTTGPCNPWDHYMLPPEDRLVGGAVTPLYKGQTVLGAARAMADRQDDVFAQLGKGVKIME